MLALCKPVDVSVCASQAAAKSHNLYGNSLDFKLKIYERKKKHTHPNVKYKKLWIVFQPAVYLLPRVILNICLLESILKTTSVNLPALVILMALALVVSYSLMVATMFA